MLLKTKYAQSGLTSSLFLSIVLRVIIIPLCLYMSIAHSTEDTNSYANLSDLGRDAELVSLALDMKEKYSSITENSVTRLALHQHIELSKNEARYTTIEVWHYPNQASVQDYGYERIYYDAASQRLQSLSAITILKNGKQLKFDNADIQSLDSDEYNSFTDGKELIINYVGLGKDSLSVIEYTIVEDRSKLENVWSDIYFTRSYRKQGEIRYVLNTTDEQEVFFHSDSNTLACEQSNQQITCEDTFVEALPNDENMFFRDESDQLVFSSVDDWTPVKSKLLAGFYKAQQDNSRVKQFVEASITAEMSREEQITMLHEFVAREVRYVSVSEAGNAYTPHAVNKTFDLRYGDCKDKTALLIEMLKQIGVEAYPVLVSTKRRDPNKLKLPSPAYFNHVVLCFNFNNQNHCIDATDSTSDWRYTPSWSMADVSLPLLADAKPQTLATTPFPWAIENNITLQYLANGSQVETQEVIFKDSYASLYRSRIETKSAEEQIEWIEDIYGEVVASDKNIEANVLGIEDLPADIVINTKATFEDYVTMGENFEFEEYEPWLQSEINSVSLKNAIYKEMVSGSKVMSNISVNLPEAWTITSYPADLTLETDYIKMTRRVLKKKDSSFSINTIFEMPTVSLSVAQFEDFEKTLAVMKGQARISFTGTMDLSE